MRLTSVIPFLLFVSCNISSSKQNSSLVEDIPKASDWLVAYFRQDNINLDYSLNSLKYIDDFFDKNAENGAPKNNSKLADSLGYKMFAISSYIGQVIIKTIPGSKWITDDNDPNGEVNIEVVTKDGGHLWPGQKVFKRFKNGSEDGLYSYAYMIINYK